MAQIRFTLKSEAYKKCSLLWGTGPSAPLDMARSDSLGDACRDRHANNRGGVITASGLFFNGATTDDPFRAIDIETGKRLWEVAFSAGGQATPMKYEAGGRQIVVIKAGGHDFMETPIGDYFIAYALPAQATSGEVAERP